MKVGEIIDRIQYLYSRGIQSDDSRLLPRHIYNKVKSSRALILSEMLQKRQPIAISNYTTISCVEMIAAHTVDSPIFDDMPCKYYRTKYKFPAVMHDTTKHMVRQINTADGSTVFSEITINELSYKKSSKYTSKKPDFFIYNGYLFLTCKNVPKMVEITAMFEDPLEASAYKTACDSNDGSKECSSPMDVEYPMDDDFVEIVVKMAVEEFINIFSRIPDDKGNNTKEN